MAGPFRPGLRNLALIAVVAAIAPAKAAPSPIADFSSGNRGWVRDEFAFADPPSGLGVIKSDADHPYRVRGIDAQGREFGGLGGHPDWRNSNLKPWASEALKKIGDDTDKGIRRITDSAACRPSGVPAQMIVAEPLFIVQTPREVTIIYQRDHHVRHIFMNVPHSRHPKSTWFGESVGHYEGDELVVDTVGLNGKTVLDFWGTPHSAALHVIERYKITDAGKSLNVTFTIDDPGTFKHPWSGVAIFRQVQGPVIEAVCAENNFDHISGKMYPIPFAAQFDF